MKSIKMFLYTLSCMIVLPLQTIAQNTIVLIPVDDLMIPVYANITNVNSVSIDKSQLLTLVNQARLAGQNCGGIDYAPVNPLTWNDKIENAALAHSADMDTNNFFSHTGSDGSNVGDRFERAGYTWSAYGENIAFGYQTEQSVIEAWLNSSGHCKNIMSPLFTEMGVAKVGDYWTQDFGDTF